jgi:hypothetical protein
VALQFYEDRFVIAVQNTRETPVARNNTVWKKVLAEAKSKGTLVNVTVINGLLKKAAAKYAGLGEA